jgi:hypothetical protein
MTAQEALQISPLMTFNGELCYWNGRDIYYSSGDYFGNWMDLTTFEPIRFPDPPHLRVEEAASGYDRVEHNFLLNETKRLRDILAKLESANDKLETELQQLRNSKSSPIVLRNCESDPPDDITSVLIFRDSDDPQGLGWVADEVWRFQFETRSDQPLADFFYCEIPAVVMPGVE